MTGRQRLDQLLVTHKLVPTRSRARDLILSGVVLIDGTPAAKPSQTLAPDTKITLAPDANPYVSRAALKLVHALACSRIDPKGRIALDIGASTGGFSQVLADRGAAKIYAVDVGRDQLHESLRNTSTIVSLEATDARQLSADHIPVQPDLLVCDASFISLEKILPVPISLLAPKADLIALIKPQFEVGRDRLPKDGIVKSQDDRLEARGRIVDWLGEQPGWQVQSTELSPIRGKGGNVEYLVWAHRDPATASDTVQ